MTTVKTVSRNINVDVEVDVDIEFDDVLEYVKDSPRYEQRNILDELNYDVVMDYIRKDYEIPIGKTHNDQVFQKACFKLMEYRHTLPKGVEDMIIGLAKEHTV